MSDFLTNSRPLSLAALSLVALWWRGLGEARAVVLAVLFHRFEAMFAAAFAAISDLLVRFRARELPPVVAKAKTAVACGLGADEMPRCDDVAAYDVPAREVLPLTRVRRVVRAMVAQAVLLPVCAGRACQFQMKLNLALGLRVRPGKAADMAESRPPVWVMFNLDQFSAA